jgi:hypothetical protein
MIAIRFYYYDNIKNALTWDALGYYLYLPGKYIYNDLEYLSWWPVVAEQYHFPGNFYQASMQANGKYVLFYSIGISILQTPFFFVGHGVAGLFGFPQDGFSFPYPLAICVGMLVYAFIGLIFLRKFLLKYFEDSIVAWGLLLTVLATNYPQYTAIEAGMTHGYLFTLFCLLLLFTAQWHEKPSYRNALIIGGLLGVATVCRPTDAVIIFIPLLWNTHNKELRRLKLLILEKDKLYAIAFVVGGIIPLIPQFLYWKSVTGSFLHKMGSKWDFLSPHWQVIIGWEKGWFIYTPVTVLMVIGLFFMKHRNYQRALLTYFILNLWIVIAWHVWRFGASYSARALTQSLAVLSLPLCSLLEKLIHKKWQIAIGILVSLYLCTVNLFQIWQYNQTIIHYDDMNRRYYAAVYLNPLPSPAKMSLLDTDEYIDSAKLIFIKTLSSNTIYQLNGSSDTVAVLIDNDFSSVTGKHLNGTKWLKITALVKSEWGAYNVFMITEFQQSDCVKKRSVRMQNGICDLNKWNKIEYYFKIPALYNPASLKIYIRSSSLQNVMIRDFHCNIYQEKTR